MNRKLLFVAPSAYPLGGVATWLDYLLPGLEQLGWEPTLGLVSGRFHDVDQYLEQHPYHRVLRISNPTGSQEGRVRALGAAVVKTSPAVTLSVNIPHLFMAMARLRQKGSQAKAVMTLHGIQSDLLGDVRFLADMLDAVICTNRLACQLVEDEAGVLPERVLYAPYGVSIPTITPEKNPSGDRPLRIAWVGRLEEQQKRISDIPRIFLELDRLGLRYEMWIVGSGPDEASLRSACQDWVIKGKVVFRGQLPHADISEKIYQNSDVFLLTSSWETGPIVAWEAMAHGVPVVSSRDKGSVEEAALVHGSNCFMFDIGNMRDAAKWLETLRDPKIAKTLVDGGRALVRERYTFEKSIGAWDLVLHKIASREPLTGVTRKNGIAPRGRLDHLCGVSMAETIRSRFGLKFAHQTAGSEWPHTLRRNQDSEVASSISKALTS
jgi:glycosyltransferase involved in cell wall biosynthesis